MSKLLIVISGPSGVGKRCILEGVNLYCDLRLLKCDFNKIVLYNTRDIRATESDGDDYHYCYGDFVTMGASDRVRQNKQRIADEKTETRLNSQVLQSQDGLFTFPVRNKDLQGIDLQDINDGVNFLEIYDQFIDALQPQLAQEAIKIIRLFISPFTQNELYARSPQTDRDAATAITNEMSDRIRGRRKLGLSNEDEAEIAKRTDGAVKEILDAFATDNPYDAIIINPCGESHPSWGTANTMPVGEARTVIETVCKVIEAQL